MLALNQALKHERYRIIRCIEQDSAGARYEVYDNDLQTNALLKEIPIKLNKVATAARQEEIKLAFVGEAKILTEIKHEHLQNAYDYFTEIDRQYLVLESIDGKDFSELLEKKKSAFAVADVLKWADQLLDSLGYLHKQAPPIIHRSVNPQNIKLTSSGTIKTLAFGLAKKGEARENSASKNQTFGAKTLSYLPLEQIFPELDSASQKVITNSYDEKSEIILKQPADARSDVYAAGATLYHLFTARLPIDALERSIDILEGKSDPLPPPHRLKSDIPPAISDVLMKALEIKRENRFDSAIIMRQILRTTLAQLKERAAVDAKEEEEIMLELPAARQMSLEKELQFGDQVRLKIESEQKRQTELIKQQLRESESQRLKAEQRAAEIERRLREKEIKESGENESLTDSRNSSANFKSILTQADAQPDSRKPNTTVEDSAGEFENLFAQPRKENKVWKQMSVAALVLILLGGAVFGFLNFQAFEKALPNQAVPNQLTTIADDSVPEPIVETTPLPTVQPIETAPTPNVEITPEVQAAAEDYVAPGAPKTPFGRTSFKNKPVPPTQISPRIEKRSPPPIKAQPKPQKAVTVDDIINNN